MKLEIWRKVFAHFYMPTNCINFFKLNKTYHPCGIELLKKKHFLFMKDWMRRNLLLLLKAPIATVRGLVLLV